MSAKNKSLAGRKSFKSMAHVNFVMVSPNIRPRVSLRSRTGVVLPAQSHSFVAGRSTGERLPFGCMQACRALRRLDNHIFIEDRGLAVGIKARAALRREA